MADGMGLKLKGILFLFGGLLLGVFLGVLVYTGSQGGLVNSSSGQKLPPAVGSAAPDFSLPGLGGSQQGLNEAQGKPVVVNFWATWCPPCVEEMPLLDKYAQKYAGQLVIYGIDSAEEEAQVARFISDNEIRFPILLDEDANVTDAYFVRNFPATFFIDADGVLRAQHLGTLREDLLIRYLATIGIQE